MHKIIEITLICACIALVGAGIVAHAIAGHINTPAGWVLCCAFLSLLGACLYCSVTEKDD